MDNSQQKSNITHILNQQQRQLPQHQQQQPHHVYHNAHDDGRGSPHPDLQGTYGHQPHRSIPEMAPLGHISSQGGQYAQPVMVQQGHQDPYQQYQHSQPPMPQHPPPAQQQYYSQIPHRGSSPMNTDLIPQPYMYPPMVDQQQYQRKRQVAKTPRTRRKTMIACENCRLKKIKCSNEKPVCQNCLTHGYNCFYREESLKESSSKVKRESPMAVPMTGSTTSMDAQNDDQILNKLDLILGEIQTLKASSAKCDAAADSIDASSTLQQGQQQQAYVTPISSELADNNTEKQTPFVRANWYASWEHMLQWPTFQNRFTEQHIVRQLSRRNSATLSVEFDLEEFRDPVRCEKYLRKLIHNLFFYVNSFVNNCHTKCPVIDLAKLYTTVQLICDQKSVNVDVDLERHYPVSIALFAAALGMLSAPLDRSPNGEPQKVFQNSLEQLKDHERFAKFSKLYRFACYKELEVKDDFEDYLQTSPLNFCIVQFLKKACHMYLLRPLEAWRYLQSAIDTLLTFLRANNYPLEGESAQEEEFSEISKEERKLIERLFWIFYKEDSELRVELAPHTTPHNSDILNFPPPASFPVPVLFDSAKLKPTLDSLSSSAEDSDDSDRDLIDTNDRKGVNEQNDTIWYWFLNETALRKLENNFLEDLYGEPVSKAWIPILTDSNNLNSMLFKIVGYIQELNDIVDKLHPAIKEMLEQSEEQVLQNLSTSNSKLDDNFSPTANENNKKIPIFKLAETVVFIKTRIVTMKMLLCRPIFMYFSCLEKKEDILAFVTNPIIGQMVRESFSLANIANPELLRHRHNGTWYVLRNLVVGCTYILTSMPKILKYPQVVEALAPDPEMVVPGKEAFVLFIAEIINVLEYWKEEAPEFQFSIDVLKELAAENGFANPS